MDTPDNINDLRERILVLETENKRLKASEVKFKNLIDTLPIGYYRSTSDGFFIDVNEALVKMLGYDSRDELLSIYIPKDLYFNEEDREIGILYNEDFLEDTDTYRLKRKDGSELWVEDYARYHSQENDILIHEGMLIDITSRMHAEKALRLSEEKYRIIADNSADVIWILNLDLTHRYISPSIYQMTGWTPEEYLKLPITKTVLKESLEPALKIFQEEIQLELTGTANTNRTRQFELTEYRKDGSTYNAEVSVSFIRDLNRKPVGILGVTRDITDRVESRLKIQEQAERIRTLLKAIPDILFVQDENGTFLEAYAPDESILLVPIDKIVGNNIRDLFNEELSNRFLQSIQLCLATSEIITVEYELPINQLRYFEARIAKLNDNSVMVIVRDITARKQAEELIIESEKRYRQLVENMQEGLLLVDNEDKILFVNSSFCKLLGYEKKELIGKIANEELLAPENRYLIINKNKDRLVGKSEQYELEMITKSGQKRMFIISAVPVMDLSSDVLGSMSTFLDITDRKQSEKEIKLLLEKVTESRDLIELNLHQKNLLIKELEDIKDILTRSNVEKDKFFSILAHDLKSPFFGFLGLTKILSETIDELTSDEIKEFATHLKESADNLYKLLENLLQWSRLQRGSINFNPEEIRLIDIIDKTIDINKHLFKIKQLSLVNLLPNDISVYADLQMLYAIFRNLLSNAIKFTNENGIITIEAKQIDDKIEISVTDSGIGIPDDLIDKLFMLGEQTSRLGTHKEPSTGLGLLLCKEYVERHGGIIKVTSKVNEGSTFTFTMPIKE